MDFKTYWTTFVPWQQLSDSSACDIAEQGWKNGYAEALKQAEEEKKRSWNRGYAEGLADGKKSQDGEQWNKGYSAGVVAVKNAVTAFKGS